MNDHFADMRKQALRLWGTSNGSTVPAEESLVLEWKLEVMDRIEAIERFLDRDDDD